MNQFTNFQDALSLNKKSENKFTIIPNVDFFVGNTPHGVYLMAIMQKALTNVLPHSTAISSSVQYLDRIESKPIDLEVEVFKMSRGS